MRSLLGAGEVQETVDVVIVGAGIAGLFLAERLLAKGLKVGLVEAGPAAPKGDSTGLYAPSFALLELGSAIEGRSSGLGGTSQLWGGALLPMLDEDLLDDPAGWGLKWPVTPDELAPHIAAVETRFGLPAGAFDEPPDGSAGWVQRDAKWPRFERRNVAQLMKRSVADAPRLALWTDAAATELLSAEGRASGVVARASDGSRLTVSAPHVVVASGTIETTRLMLAFDRALGDRLDPQGEFLGRYLTDHLSAHYAHIEPRDRAKLERLSTYAFERGGMRNRRWSLIGSARANQRLPGSAISAFAISDVDGPFEALRDIYRGFQRGALPRPGELVRLAKGAPWVARAAWLRFVERRLAIAPSARFVLNLSIEQVPSAGNRIRLNEHRPDPNGLETVTIEWRPTAQDVANFERSGAAYAKAWQRAGFDAVGQLRRREEASAEIAASRGTLHSCGTVRMAHSPAEGVLSPQLEAFACPGLYVASSAAFPTSGSANPTMTIIAMALRLADTIASAHRA